MPPLTNYTSANIAGVVMNCALHPGKLNICHGNVQSLCARKFAKLDDVKDLLLDSKVTVACFTESWLTTKITDRSIAIPGFIVCRNDRGYQRGGGIVIYYRNHISCEKLFHTQLSGRSADKTECLVVELRFGDETVLLATFYNPPGNNCCPFLEERLAEYGSNYNNIMLIGDFNIDVSRPGNQQSQFKSILDTFAFVSVGEEPTFFHNSGCSQLDLFITCRSDKVLRFNQVGCPVLSQHDLIFASLDFYASPASRVETYRDFANFDASVLANAVSSQQFSTK